MSEEFLHEVGGYFTKEEWKLWGKGQFNLFDNFVERVGMTEDDADRLRNKFRSPPPLEKKKPLTQEEVKSILDSL